MQYRYRMQSLKTMWGVEAEPTPEGKKQLEQLRRQNPGKFKFCRIYLMKQLIPEHHKYLEPFQLVSIKDLPYAY